jgi:hypothetical protein
MCEKSILHSLALAAVSVRAEGKEEDAPNPRWDKPKRREHREQLMGCTQALLMSHEVQELKLAQ